MAIDETLARPSFHPWTDEERRSAALKIVEQLRANKRLAAELKDGKDRLEKLLADFQAGGVERAAIEDQPDLFDGDGDRTAYPGPTVGEIAAAPPLELTGEPGEPEPPTAA